MPKSKKTKQSKMTLDKLALMMGRGFNEVTEKFNEVAGKFEEVADRIDSLEGKMDKVINTQDKILKDVEDLKKEKVMDMSFRIRFNELERRVEVIEAKTARNK